MSINIPAAWSEGQTRATRAQLPLVGWFRCHAAHRRLKACTVIPRAWLASLLLLYVRATRSIWSRGVFRIDNIPNSFVEKSPRLRVRRASWRRVNVSEWLTVCSAGTLWFFDQASPRSYRRQGTRTMSRTVRVKSHSQLKRAQTRVNVSARFREFLIPSSAWIACRSIGRCR